MLAYPRQELNNLISPTKHGNMSAAVVIYNYNRFFHIHFRLEIVRLNGIEVLLTRIRKFLYKFMRFN